MKNLVYIQNKKLYQIKKRGKSKKIAMIMKEIINVESEIEIDDKLKIFFFDDQKYLYKLIKYINVE